ncbi:helix-turn-helix domain-containing protein [Ligilactobacillus equi]|uniref:Transcriptional regulator n=1 Tax=Ligilactobacillus equi DPC 6820 TaxID=1392007 RepID=V7HVQ7_9LACO|nr:helix-turn-helix transcriptional regulator [Ligilactobacillus equi]ETA73340.1 transcriptional regulator [Ligilactobacillus equi DPC 6820]
MENRIKELRKERGITLKELSEAVGLAISTLSGYEKKENEKGSRNPKIENWEKLADFFGVTVEYLQGYGVSRDEMLNFFVSILSDYDDDPEAPGYDLMSRLNSYISPKTAKNVEKLVSCYSKGENFTFTPIEWQTVMVLEKWGKHVFEQHITLLDIQKNNPSVIKKVGDIFRVSGVFDAVVKDLSNNAKPLNDYHFLSKIRPVGDVLDVHNIKDVTNVDGAFFYSLRREKNKKDLVKSKKAIKELDNATEKGKEDTKDDNYIHGRINGILKNFLEKLTVEDFLLLQDNIDVVSDVFNAYLNLKINMAQIEEYE